MYILKEYNHKKGQYTLSYQRHLDASSQHKTDGLVVDKDLKKKINTLNVLLLKNFWFCR